MNYMEYESFIHPDVLSAFLIKGADVYSIVSSEAVAGSDRISLRGTDGVLIGDNIYYDGVAYMVIGIDNISKQVILDSPLQTTVETGKAITLVKSDKRNALKNFYDIGERDYNVFSKSLIDSGVPVRFDSDVYILKRAFIAMYSWILQNKAFLRNLNLTGIGIAKSEVYEHFYKLLEAEKDDMEAMRKEAMDEVARKQQNDADGKSGTGFIRYTAPNKSYFSGYRNGRR